MEKQLTVEKMQKDFFKYTFIMLGSVFAIGIVAFGFVLYSISQFN